MLSHKNVVVETEVDEYNIAYFFFMTKSMFTRILELANLREGSKNFYFNIYVIINNTNMLLNLRSERRRVYDRYKYFKKQMEDFE